MSTNEDNTDTAQVPQTGCEGCTGTTGFLLIMMGMLTLFILFDPSTRASIGKGIGFILFPLIGFDFNGDAAGDYPLFTILAAAIITGTWSTVIRHFSTDWIRNAEIQNYLNTYNKELQKAMRNRNQGRIKQLNKMQPEIMKLQNEMMMGQMKQMVLTMFVAIIIFTWIWQGFIPTLPKPEFSVPWAGMVKLTDNPYLFPNWILLYSLFSIVFSQVLMRGLKVISFRRALEKETVEERKRARALIERLEHKIDSMERDGMVVEKFRNKIKKEWEMLEGGEGLSVAVLGGELERDMDKERGIFKEAYEAMKAARKDLRIGKKMGYLTETSRKVFKDGKNAFESGNYRLGHKLFEAFRSELQMARNTYDELMVDLMDLEGEVEDAYKAGLDTKELRAKIQDARYEVIKGNFDSARENIKSIKERLGSEMKRMNEVKRAFETLEERYNEVMKLGISIDHETAQRYKDIESSYRTRKLSGLLTPMTMLTSDLEDLIEGYKKAQDELSFARLVVKNAQEYGLDMKKYERELAEAEDMIVSGRYTEAMARAMDVRKRAEEEKKRAKRRAKKR